MTMTTSPSTADAPALVAPRTRRQRGVGNGQLYGWLFMRLSGVVLLVLVFGHLFVNLVMGEGIKQIDFAFVAGKWASPFWQIWDFAMLWLALLHGGNGMRTIINDYSEKDSTRLWLTGLLYAAVAVTLLVGTLTITTFDPCIDPESTLSVCTA